MDNLLQRIIQQNMEYHLLLKPFMLQTLKDTNLF
jgi:hypothetical protein